MDGQQHVPMEEMEVFRRFVTVADWAWTMVTEWPPFARDTLGKQLVRACDSVAANLVEGDGRYRDADALHFFVIGRASAREARYWLQRAMIRGLLDHQDGAAKITEIVTAAQLLNRLITYRRNRGRTDRVQEETTYYETDPFSPALAEEERRFAAGCTVVAPEPHSSRSEYPLGPRNT
jgi:four helix bundle protein